MRLRTLLLLPLLLTTPQVHSQTPTTPTITFAFDRPGALIPKYVLLIHEDGTGSYKGEEVTPASPYPGVSTPSAPIDRTFALSPATTRTIFSLAHDLHGSGEIDCATRIKNLANTGTKTLAYQDQQSQVSCTYNYSDNKSVTKLTQLFQALTETMDAGRRLDHLHRFDRLGLDAAITLLAEELSDGRAIEVGTIEPTLRSLANDAEILQRVRTRATSLLSLTHNP